MNKIKLNRVFKLMIPKKYNQNEIIRELERAIGKRVMFSMGLLDSFSVLVQNEDETIETFLDINIKVKNGIAITIISQEIRGEKVYNKEVFEKEPTVMESICNKIAGLVLINDYEITSCCQNTNTYYSINYDENSLDYKIINSMINDMDEPLEVIALTQIIKNKKNDLTEILKDF